MDGQFKNNFDKTEQNNGGTRSPAAHVKMKIIYFG